MTEIVITGTAAITAAGSGVEKLWEAMAAGESFVRAGNGTPAALPWPSAPVDRSTVAWPEGQPWVNNRKYANLSAHWAVSAARQALERAGTADPDGPPGPGSAARCGTVMAVGSNGDELSEIMPKLAVMAQTDPRPLAKLLYDEVPDYSYIRGIPSQLGQFAAMASGFRGSNVAAYGEVGAGGLGALALARRMIESGELDRVLVVGVAPPLSVGALAAFDREEPLGTKAELGRGPFDAERAGTLIGEAAAAVMIERAEVARDRGVMPLADLSACETVTATSREAAAAAAVGAVLNLTGRNHGAWWAHGAGSVALDAEEARTVGPLLGALPATSSKGTIGNAFECSALIDVALAVEAVRRGQVPPVGLLQKPDPDLDVDAVAGTARRLEGDGSVVLTGFGQGRGASTVGAAVVAPSRN